MPQPEATAKEMSMLSHLISPLALAFALVVFAAPAPAQTPTVSGQGSAELRRFPDRLRVHVDVAAKGKDLREALDRLKDRREVVRKKLTDLKAEEIQFGDPGASETSAQQRQYEQMIAQRMGGGKRAKPKVDLPVEMQFTVRFEMPLKQGTIEELIVQSSALRTRIKEADLGGLKDAPKLSPEEEEVEEEIRGMMNRGGGEEVKRGEPTFAFIAKIDPADMKKTLAEAYSQAARQARTLAEAAGAELGELVSLHSPTMSGEGYDPREMAMARYYGREVPSLGLVGANEAGGPTPGQQVFRVQVQAGYRLKQKGAQP
jgi:uncharacterized protein YggE